MPRARNRFRRCALQRRRTAGKTGGMPSFKNGAVEIAYLDEGEGEPIVLVHGFASTKEVNWVKPGWVRTLTRRRPARDRARQSRPRRNRASCTIPPPITAPLMADDVRALLDHLGIERADVMGYSMGARITAFLALNHPGARALGRSSAASAFAWSKDVGLPESIAEALEAPSLADVARSDRAHLPRFRRADQIRSQGARRLHARLAPDVEPRAGGRHSRADAGRGRHQGRCRRFSARNWPRSFRARARSIFRTATTCWRSATRCSKPACSTSLTSAHEPCAGRYSRALLASS